MAKKRQNASPTVPVKISTTQPVVDALNLLAETGFHGKNPSEVAEELLRRTLLNMWPEAEPPPGWPLSKQDGEN